MSTSYSLGNYASIDEQSNKFSFSFQLEDSEAGFDIGDEKDLNRLKNYLKEILNKKDSSITFLHKSLVSSRPEQVTFKADVNDEGMVNFTFLGDRWEYFIPLEVKYDQLIEDIETICEMWPIVDT